LNVREAIEIAAAAVSTRFHPVLDREVQLELRARPQGVCNAVAIQIEQPNFGSVRERRRRSILDRS
jgi:hypothetical protein